MGTLACPPGKSIYDPDLTYAFYRSIAHALLAAGFATAWRPEHALRFTAKRGSVAIVISPIEIAAGACAWPGLVYGSEATPRAERDTLCLRHLRDL
jgi:hypothetical protein